MLPYDIHAYILEKVEYEYYLMALRSVSKDWAQTCEIIIRNRSEHNIKNMLESCRYKCEKVPLKWIVRRNLIRPMVEYRCAYCNGITYALGECKNKHRKRHKIIQDICIGPFVLVCSVLFLKKCVVR